VPIVVWQRHLDRAGLPWNTADPDKATLIKEIAAWERRRNTGQVRISWMLTVDRVREKLGRVYSPVARDAVRAA
jgi:hypothetical protein